MEDNVEVVILGGGLTGLTCALHLQSMGITYRLIDIKKVGGKLQSDGDYDVGFQTILSCYPNLDLAGINLAKSYKLSSNLHFIDTKNLKESSTSFRFIGSFGKGLRTLFSTDLWSIGDRATFLSLLFKIRSIDPDPNISSYYRSISIADFLNSTGLSYRVVNRFIKPFLRGVFLSNEPLEYNALSFINLFRYFTLGSARIPKGGMKSIIKQLAAKLDHIWEECTIAQISKTHIRCNNYNNFSFKTLIFAGLEPILSSFELMSPTLKDNLNKVVDFSGITRASSEAVDCLYFKGDFSKTLHVFNHPSYISLAFNPNADAYVLMMFASNKTLEENAIIAMRDMKQFITNCELKKTYRISSPVWRNLPNLNPIRSYKIENVLFHNRNIDYQDSIDSAIRAGYELAYEIKKN